MKKPKKYRVIINTIEEYNELKKVYGDIIMSFSNTMISEPYYIVTWAKGGRNLSLWGAGSIDYPEIKPITFKEWKEDYYKSIEIPYEIY